MVQIAVDSYRKWEESNYPGLEKRFGISAEVVREIYNMEMQCSDMALVRDAAKTVF